MEIVSAVTTSIDKVKEFTGAARDLIPWLRKTESGIDGSTKALFTSNEAYSQAVVISNDYTDAIRRVKHQAEDGARTFRFYDDAIMRGKRSQDAATRSAKEFEDAIADNVVLQALRETIGEGFDPLQAKIAAVASGMEAFRSTASSSLTDVIMGTKSLNDALGEIVNATLKALIQGFINLGITIFVLEPLERFLRNVANRQRLINGELRQELALRTAIAAFSAFTGGVGGFFGGFFANGGNVAGNTPIVVGERGPELFIPNTAGKVIPNNEMAGYGSGGMGGGGDNIEVTFNINTIDATDFDQLLTTRQDLIIGLINRGLAERGKRSLTA